MLCENCKKCIKKEKKEKKKTKPKKVNLKKLEAQKLLGEGKKKCKHCSEIKQLDQFDFHNPKKFPEKRRPECKSCRKIKNKLYYQKKKELKKQQKKVTSSEPIKEETS